MIRKIRTRNDKKKKKKHQDDNNQKKKNTDKNKDGRLDIDEVASAILGATKEARSAQKREKTLKRSLLGVSAFLAVFAVIFLITQGVQLSKSIEESKVT